MAKNAVINFIERWQNKGDEKSETQKFWLELLHEICGIENPSHIIEFEKRVQLEHKSFIDAYIPSTKIIIEQKSSDIDLGKAAKQSDGSMLTPFEQVKKYYDWLPFSERCRWIITCNFKEFWIYDMEMPKAKPEIIKLENLEKECGKLAFLADKNAASPKDIRELEVSKNAGKLIRKFYDAVKPRYHEPESPEALRSLNILCVRLVFLLYAEDDELFDKNAFHDYLKLNSHNARGALLDLFKILSQPEDKRDEYINKSLKNFPYVNGGLFEEDLKIEIPNLNEPNDEPVKIILDEMSGGFDWSSINPTIFGAIFESTLNKETRGLNGMHYTSLENIHRLIDPLFLDNLKRELHELLEKSNNKKLKNFQDKLAELKFLDPACGSGNFLTETYLSLRRLENKILKELSHGQRQFAEGDLTPIKVSINQFYGIEINDFAASVAKTALWIAEHQMRKETEEIIDVRDAPLPLKSYANIIEGNALKIDWNEVIDKDKLNYIIGNPPFRGYSNQSTAQKADILSIYVDENGRPYNNAGKIDYVAGWYFKAAEFINQNAKIHAAFVSTNSITQGEQVSAVWRPLFERFNIKINFAWRTFKWSSESSDMAQVHVVIIGFSCGNVNNKTLFELDGGGTVKSVTAANINPYLVDAETVFIEARKRTISKDVPMMRQGSMPQDDGNLLLTEAERDELLQSESQAAKFIRPFMMGKDFIDRKPRYCLWLVDASSTDIKNMPLVYKRVEAVREFRLASTREATRELADTSWLFGELRQPTKDYIAMPIVSSENRKYIPIDYMSSNIIPGNKLFTISGATLYHFGILTSRVHMAWMRAVCGRLEMRYSYSNTIVYNNFPWPEPNAKQKVKIEAAAQKILEARALYPASSLADLYNDLLMPSELRRAHKLNDAAVCSAYGFDENINEADIVAQLMRLYQQKIAE